MFGTAERLSFHVIIDDANQTFSINGPDGPSGIRLHFEMALVARALNRRLRDFDVQAESQETILEELQRSYPSYRFVGSWLDQKHY